MPDLTITAARANILRAIADPNTEVYASIPALRGSWSTAQVWLAPAEGREKQITNAIRPLEAASLVKRGPGGARYHAPRHYTLTDDGRQALTDYDAKAAQ